MGDVGKAELDEEVLGIGEEAPEEVSEDDVRQALGLELAKATGKSKALPASAPEQAKARARARAWQG